MEAPAQGWCTTAVLDCVPGYGCAGSWTGHLLAAFTQEELAQLCRDLHLTHHMRDYEDIVRRMVCLQPW